MAVFVEEDIAASEMWRETEFGLYESELLGGGV
jgi:hypothetical protein